MPSQSDRVEEPRWKKARPVLFAVIVLILLGGGFYWEIASTMQSPENFQRPLKLSFAHQSLRELRLALAAYHNVHGTYPYHPAGSDYGLYLLNEFVEASSLANVPPNHQSPAPYWDHEHKVARNTGWEYINDQNIETYDVLRIILVSKDAPDSDVVYFALKGGPIYAYSFERYPGREALGKYVTSEGQLVTDREKSLQ